MATEEVAESGSPLDEVMDDIWQELVRRVAAADREENRVIYDALEDEQRNTCRSLGFTSTWRT